MSANQKPNSDCCPLPEEIAYSLILWIIEEWPCSPPQSTIPLDPSQLSHNCSEILSNYDPKGDEKDPSNSAFLLPKGLEQHAASLDKMERIGRKSKIKLNHKKNKLK